jgi:hypothetical protein
LTTENGERGTENEYSIANLNPGFYTREFYKLIKLALTLV